MWAATTTIVCANIRTDHTAALLAVAVAAVGLLAMLAAGTWISQVARHVNQHSKDDHQPRVAESAVTEASSRG